MVECLNRDREWVICLRGEEEYKDIVRFKIKLLYYGYYWEKITSVCVYSGFLTYVSLVVCNFGYSKLFVQMYTQISKNKSTTSIYTHSKRFLRIKVVKCGFTHCLIRKHKQYLGKGHSYMCMRGFETHFTSQDLWVHDSCKCSRMLDHLITFPLNLLKWQRKKKNISAPLSSNT